MQKKIFELGELIMVKTAILLGALGVAILAQGAEPAYRRGMTMTKPSERWQDALPAGNGQVGAPCMVR